MTLANGDERYSADTVALDRFVATTDRQVEQLSHLLEQLRLARQQLVELAATAAPRSSLVLLDRHIELVARTGRFVDGVADELGSRSPEHRWPVGPSEELFLRHLDSTGRWETISSETVGSGPLVNIPGPSGVEILVNPLPAGLASRLMTPPAEHTPSAGLPTPPAPDLGRTQRTPAAITGLGERLGSGEAPIDQPSLPPEPAWTPTRIDHVLDGNASGGWHHRPGGVDRPGRRVTKVTERIGRGRLAGVYRADVEIRLGSRTRTKQSTFFPDHWTRSRVIATIDQAYRRTHAQGRLAPGRQLPANDDRGFPITLVVDENGRVLSAYPRIHR